MDFSTKTTGKKGYCDERIFHPTPSAFKKDLVCGGILFDLLLDSVSYAPYYQGERRKKDLRRFNFFCLSQLLDGDGFYYAEGYSHPQKLRPGDWLLVSPGFPHRYGGDTQVWIEDAVCFHGPLSDALYRRGLIRDGTFHLGQERKLLPIIRLLRKKTISATFWAQAALLELLLEIHEIRSRSQVATKLPALEQLMLKIENDKHLWSVAEMAESLNMSCSGLRVSFANKTGMSPMEFLNQVWLKKVFALLANQELSLQTVAELSCPGNVYYFYRKFKKMSGCTPLQYRKQY